MFKSNDDFKSLVSTDLKVMEDFILSSSTDSKISLAVDVILHLIKSGGKRLRPMLVLIICKMLNCSDNKRIYVAAAIEFIHNATLLHDDVLDASEIRRGVDTANKIWGNKTSILVGDFLLTMAFKWLIQCENLNVLSVLSQSSSTIIGGEIKQMSARNNIDMTEQDYINIISAKTAALFSAACEAASIISGTSIQQKEALRGFGFNFGIAFQMIDDTLDYIANQDEFGKKLGNDFYDGKVTLPIIISYDMADVEEKKFWQRSLTVVERSDNDFKKALFYINSHNAIELAIEKAKFYIDTAKENLNIFSDSIYKSALINLLNLTPYRKI